MLSWILQDRLLVDKQKGISDTALRGAKFIKLCSDHHTHNMLVVS